MKKYFIIISLIILSACSTNAVKGENLMLSEIYAIKKPNGFEQIDVNNIVLKYFPIGIEKTQALNSLKNIKDLIIKEESDKQIFIRHNLGLAMLDPDARSIVIELFFDSENKLIKINAVYIKNQ